MDHAHHVFSPCLHHAAARFWRERLPRLGQDHPRKAPPVGNKTPVDVVLQVVALLCGKIERAFLGKSIEPGVILWRQVVVGKAERVNDFETVQCRI